MKNIFITLLLYPLFHSATKLYAQDPNPDSDKWTFRTRLILTGSSDRSDPDGYLVYSAVSIEPSLSRKLTRHLTLELNARTESHEVDFSLPGTDEAIPLGSIELIPVNLTLQFRIPSKGNFHLYAGAGINATFCWEKSGALNSTDLTPGFGPSVQLGTDIDLTSYFSLNVYAGWNALNTDIEDRGMKTASLDIDPIAFGVGLAYRF